MPSAEETNRGARFGRMQHRRGGVEVFGIFGFGKRQIQPAERVHARAERLRVFGDGGGKRREDSANLIPLGKLQLADAVIQLHNGERLHEKRRAGRGLVVNDAFEFPLEIRAQRQHIASVPLGDEGILKHGGGARVGEIFLQFAHQPPMRGSHFPSDRSKRRGGGIEYLSFFGERLRNRGDQPQRRREGIGKRGEAREGIGLFKRGLEPPHDDESRFELEERFRVKDAAARRAFDVRTKIRRAADTGIGMRIEKTPRLGCFLQTGAGGFARSRRTQRARQRLRAAERAVGSEGLLDAVVFENAEGFGIHYSRVRRIFSAPRCCARSNAASPSERGKRASMRGRGSTRFFSSRRSAGAKGPQREPRR